MALGTRRTHRRDLQYLEPGLARARSVRRHDQSTGIGNSLPGSAAFKAAIRPFAASIRAGFSGPKDVALQYEKAERDLESVINGQPLSDDSVLIEKFTLADANTLDYRMTINDAKVYTAPWTLRLPIPREDTYGFYEYACHEGNYAMKNLLSGSRAEDQRRSEARTSVP